MKSQLRFLSLFVLIAALIGTGCSATYKTTLKTQLQQREGVGPIRALTVDSLLYTFETFSFTDSVLRGRGTLKRNGTTSGFEGSVPFRRIVFIERLETSYGKGFWVVPMFAGIIAGVSMMISEPAMFDVRRPGGSSCPYVWAFDGTEFKLEAEAFGTSISKALEGQTCSLLPSLAQDMGKLKVRISNERPETHLLNSVQLSAADAQDVSLVVLDINNVLWPVPNAIPPISASDHSGNDILHDIAKVDGQYWKSDLAHTAPFSGFRDHLDVQFDLPRGASEATLVIHAINTELISEVYRSVGAVLGDATLQFYHALEHDPQLQNNIREWIRECGLRIEITNGTDHKQVETILPEATVTPFSRAIRIKAQDDLQGPLHVRLSSLTDVWRINAVSIDYSPVRPIPLHPLKMLSVTSSDNTNWKDAITSSDSSYALILPPNHIDVTFDPAPTLGMRKPVYALAMQGYLYEWFPTRADATPSSMSKTTTETDCVALLKLLIQQKNLFLPPIYATWQREKHDENDR